VIPTLCFYPVVGRPFATLSILLLSLRVSRVGFNGRSDSCRQKGVEHVLDCIGDSLDAVAAGIAHWLYDGWGHSYPPCYRQRYSTDPSRSGIKDDERHCSEVDPLTCSGRRAVPMKPIRLFRIASYSGEKERVEPSVRKIKEIKNIKNELVVFTGSMRGE
jgi:hypothetical protein